MGLRDELLLGSTHHTFEPIGSPAQSEDWQGRATMIFVPNGGAVLTGIYIDNNPTNRLSDFTNSPTGTIPAGTVLCDAEGFAITKVTGTSGDINPSKG